MPERFVADAPIGCADAQRDLLRLLRLHPDRAQDSGDDARLGSARPALAEHQHS